MPAPKTRTAQLRNVGVFATALATGAKIDTEYTDAQGVTTVRHGVKVQEIIRTGKDPRQVLFTVKIDGEDGIKRLRGDRLSQAGRHRARKRK